MHQQKVVPENLSLAQLKKENQFSDWTLNGCMPLADHLLLAV